MKAFGVALALALALTLHPARAAAQTCEGRPSVCTNLKTVEACAQCVREKGWARQSGGYNYCRCWLAQRKK